LVYTVATMVVTEAPIRKDVMDQGRLLNLLENGASGFVVNQPLNPFLQSGIFTAIKDLDTFYSKIKITPNSLAVAAVRMPKFETFHPEFIQPFQKFENVGESPNIVDKMTGLLKNPDHTIERTATLADYYMGLAFGPEGFGSPRSKQTLTGFLIADYLFQRSEMLYTMSLISMLKKEGDYSQESVDSTRNPYLYCYSDMARLWSNFASVQPENSAGKKIATIVTQIYKNDTTTISS